MESLEEWLKHGVDRRPAFFGFFGERTLEGLFDLIVPRDVGADHGKAGRGRHDVGEHNGGAFALKGGDACEGFKKDDAKGVDIGLGGSAFAFAFDLFGGHIQRTAKGFSCLGDRAFCGGAGDAEVKEFEDFFAVGVGAVKEEVFGFEIAVNDLALVDVLKGGTELRQPTQKVGGWDVLEAQAAFVKGFALQVFHDKVKHAIGDLSEFTAAYDVGVIELLKDMRFALKAFVDGLFEVGIAIDAEDLDGLVGLGVEVECFVDGPKSAFSDQFDDPQRTDLHAQERIFEQDRPLCFG